MASYHIYKKGKIINIIEADEDFIHHLKSIAEIDDAIDISTIDDPKPLKFDSKKGYFVPNNPPKPSTPIIETTPTMSIIDMAKEINDLKDNFKILENKTTSQTSDMNSAIIAIKGFIMMLPDIQKSLREIKDVLESKSN